MAGSGFDLDAYLRRIGLDRRPRADGDGLDSVLRAQAATIPFENLDPLVGRPVRLGDGDLAAKLVVGRRGGYCFELNGLLSAGLGALGFQPISRLARVVWRRDVPGPRTHQVLLVEAGGRWWLADLGFGGPGPIAPIPFELGRVEHQEVGAFRLHADPRLGPVLACRVGEDWRDLYAFPDELTTALDLEGANHVAATWPRSPFRHQLKCAHHEGGGRVVLVEGSTLIERAGSDVRRADIQSGGALARVLENRFGIALDEALRGLIVRHGATGLAGTAREARAGPAR